MNLPHLPERQEKPRKKGVAMMMDKGLSINSAKEIVEVAGHLIDYAKLGFGTSLVSNGVKEKVKVYRDAGIKVYVGGTFFEACLIRDSLDFYEKWIDQIGADAIEVSDGSMYIEHKRKCDLIARFSKSRTVLSEVGAKDAAVITESDTWFTNMKKELEYGSEYVIAEARESGNVGIYDKSGSADNTLVNEIISHVDADKIIWEAPLKPQQVWFIKLIGHNVNLGNIAPADIIPLETLRLGLRGDTFFDVLPDAFHSQKLV